MQMQVRLPKVLPPLVLVVDADPESCDFYAKALKEGGMWAPTVTGADEAFEYAGDMRPDAILWNLALASNGSLQLAERLRADDRTSRIPIVGVLTATDRRQLDRSGRALFDDLLQKPIVVSRMLQRLREVIAHSLELRERSNAARAKVPGLLADSGALIQRSRELFEAGPAVEFPRPCPKCLTPLRWIERRIITGVSFDYYRACENACGLFCYDVAQRKFITLVD